MATRFTYFGFEYEILEDKQNEVALIDASSAQGRTFIPKEVEYNGQKYAVTEITGKEVEFRYEWQPNDKRRKIEILNDKEYRGAFQSKIHNGRTRDGWKRFEQPLDVIIPNSVRIIGKRAFMQCYGLTSVTIPNSIEYIDWSFCECINLKRVHICDIAAWCNISFWQEGNSNPLNYANHLYLNGDEITDLIIPNNVNDIKCLAFYGCSNITSVTIPASVKTIAKWAFLKSYHSDKMKLNIVKIENEEGNVIIDPRAFEPNVKIEYVGKPKSKPAQQQKEAESKTMTTGSADGKMTVAQLAAEFKAQFGSVLRIYNGRSKADDSLSLQEVGLTGNLALPFDGNQKVGDFIAQMAQVGLKVKVYTCDEWVACLDGLTLESSGKVKKNAVKADMEKML